MLRRLGVLVCVVGLLAFAVGCGGPSEKSFQDLSNQVSTLQKQLTDLQTSVNDLKTKVDASTQTSTSLKSDVANQGAQVKQLTTKMSALETTLQNFIDPPLVLEVTTLTSPVKQGDKVELAAKTRAGAACSIAITYPAETKVTAPKLKNAVADKTGKVAWSWKVDKKLPAGTYTVKITAVAGGKTTTQSATFTVTAPAPKVQPAKTTKPAGGKG
jgi:outer membrane murein-binding lipoprotein Lpp